MFKNFPNFENKIEQEKKMVSRMKPHVDKLMTELSKYDITFSPKDGELENVVFTRGDDEYKIAWKCFYRFSGMCIIWKDKGKDIVPFEVLDEMYICSYMATLIKNYFKIK